MMLTRVGIEEERAVYLGGYKSVVQDLSDPSPEDWALLRAAMLHIARSEGLHLEHNQWLGQDIFTSFKKKAQRRLHYLVSDSRRYRPVPQFDLQEMFPSHRMTAREAAYYYSRAALAVLASKNDPVQAIELFEDLNSIFVPRIRHYLPGGRHTLHLERELDRLPILYERVGRFEDALNFTTISFDHSWSDDSPGDVAVRRLDGWLTQLSGSGGVSTVERCLDMIYEWLDSADQVDENERGHIGECPTETRQFWAWYYGNALGRLVVVRPSLRESLLDEIEAGEWENCWHVAGVLFETPPESWSEYRQRALKFYNSSDIEYRPQGSIPWDVTQPPHLSAQSDLYWAMRAGFADAHSERPEERRVSLTDVAITLERIEAVTSSAARHELRTEQNTEILLEVTRNRVPPNREYWHELLKKELPGLMPRVPWATADHLIDAWNHRSATEWDNCKVSLCKTVESLFSRILVPRIKVLQESTELTLAIPRGKEFPRRRRRKDWEEVSISNWSRILRTATEGGINEPLRSVLPRAFPDVDLDAVVSLDIELAKIARLRGSSAHDSATSDEQRAKNSEELWGLVVGKNGAGFLARFYSALGLAEDDPGSGNADGPC